MRVGLVSPYDLAVPGGVQHQIVGLARALGDLGHDAVVIAPGRDPTTGGACPVGRSIPIPVNGSVAPMAPHPMAALRTVRAVRDGAFDVLHLHEPLAPSITIPALLAHPAPVVGTFHAAGEHTPYPWVGPLLRRLARRIDTRVAVSEPARRLASRHLGGRYELLFNGIDAHWYLSVPRTAPREPTVLVLGRLEPRKGVATLLAALEELPPEVVVWVGGDGPEGARLRRRYRDEPRIRWLGRLTDEDKLRRLRAASVLCAPALHGESFGLVLLEAMAAGVPVVASDVGGYRALTNGGRSALLVPPGDPSALAWGLLRILREPRLAEALSAAGAERVAAFSLEALARRYVDVYERVKSAARLSAKNARRVASSLPAREASKRPMGSRPPSAWG